MSVTTSPNFFTPPPLYDLLKLDREARAMRQAAEAAANPADHWRTSLLFTALKGNEHRIDEQVSRIVARYKGRVTRYLHNILDARSGELAREKFATVRVLDDHLFGYVALNDAAVGLRNGIEQTRMSLDNSGRNEPSLGVMADAISRLIETLRTKAIVPAEMLVQAGMRSLEDSQQTGTPKFRKTVDQLNERIGVVLRDSLPAVQDELTKEQKAIELAVGESADALLNAAPAEAVRPTLQSTAVRVDLSRMSDALAMPFSAHDDDWAYVLCRDSRRAHEDVWRHGPPVEYVSQSVIPLFARAAEGIRAVPRTGPYAASLDALAQNVDDRRLNLDRYVRGLSSEFAPDDRLRLAGRE